MREPLGALEALDAPDAVVVEVEVLDGLVGGVVPQGAQIVDVVVLQQEDPGAGREAGRELSEAPPRAVHSNDGLQLAGVDVAHDVEHGTVADFGALFAKPLKGSSRS